MSVKTFSMKLNSKLLLWAVLAAGVTLVCFSPVLRGEFLSWDDQALFIENPYYRGLDLSHWQWMCTTSLLGHWQPLSWLSYALDYTAWGLNPRGWHFTNLLLHAVNAVLVCLLCLAFTGRSGGMRSVASISGHDKAWLSGSYVVPILAALFWAVHPLRVEPVAWLATRGYLLCTAFCLLTVLFYLQATEQKRFPLAALLCFTLATVTKGIGMMLPPVLLLIDWALLRRITSVRTAFFCALEKIPFFALSLLTGVAAFLAKKYNGGMASVEQYGIPERAGQALYGIWFYLLKTVLPVNLSPLYNKRPEIGPVMIVLVLTAAVSIFFFLFRRKLHPVIAALGAFLLLIFPMIGFTQSGMQFFADRFTYLAAIPFSFLLAAGLVRLKALRRLILGVATAVLFLFGVQTFAFSTTWSDSLMLWGYLCERDGGNAQACNGMGWALMSRHFYTKAIEYFDKALLLDPGDATVLQNRALALVADEKYNEAFADASKALLLENSDKAVRAKILIGRGQIAEKMGNPEQALADYSAILDDQTVDPFWRFLALQSRARLYFVMGKRAETKADLEAILELPVPAGEGQSKAARLLNELKKIPAE